MMPISRHEMYGKAKAGSVAGIAGGVALLASFFGIDSGLNLPPGSFYMMIGLAVGLHGIPAILFGSIVHMVTAAAIGAVFCMCSVLHPALYLRSMWKGVFAGGVTGLEVYAIFFMPITLYLMIPALNAATSSAVSGQEYLAVSVLKAHLGTIIWGALMLHVLYGAVMGFFSGIMLQEYYKKIPKKSLYELESESMPAT
ncbi:MAG: hypothetical protein KGI10_09265 [Thaumarchaeota archaeon]|nr:hypothetical protein [Nitrososphaerota archaeon]